MYQTAVLAFVLFICFGFVPARVEKMVNFKVSSRWKKKYTKKWKERCGVCFLAFLSIQFVMHLAIRCLEWFLVEFRHLSVYFIIFETVIFKHWTHMRMRKRNCRFSDCTSNRRHLLVHVLHLFHTFITEIRRKIVLTSLLISIINENDMKSAFFPHKISIPFKYLWWKFWYWF